MPGLQPCPLCLEESERVELQQLVNKHTTPQQIALRARIILSADAGQTHRQIARELNISRDMARHWRKRWLNTAQQGHTVRVSLTGLHYARHSRPILAGHSRPVVTSHSRPMVTSHSRPMLPAGIASG